MPHFVIACVVANTTEVRYAYRDPDCGWLLGASTLHGAGLFDSFEDAEKVFDAMLAEKPRTWSDGTRGPNDAIHRGLALSYDRPEAHGSLSILPVTTGSPARMVQIDGKIETPKGYTY